MLLVVTLIHLLSGRTTLAAPSTQPIACDQARGGPYGPAMTVDICFSYYTRKPLATTFSAIRNRGFTCVHLVDYGAGCSKPSRMKPVADAARAEGLTPVLCIYPGTHSALYAAHPEWRQRMLTGIDGKCDWRTYLCPNRSEFVTAYCEQIERQMRECGFEAVQIAEIWFENWGGPQIEGQTNARYACVCDACLEKFRRRTGVDALPMLTDPQSPSFYQKPENAALYAHWVNMRIQTVQDFGKAIIAAARRANPKTCIKTMYMSDARVALDGSREFLGTDLDRMIKEWQPDVLTIQDAWQDWLQKDLQPGFIRDYAKAYRDRVRKLHPNIWLVSHADIGSKPESKRSIEWIQSFARETLAAGFNAPCFYEWHISTMAETEK